MDPLTVAAVTVLVALLGIGGGFALARMQDRVRLSGAKNQVQNLLDQARMQADNLQKQSELRVKDELIERREALNREFDQKLETIRDQERRLAKREDALEDKDQTLTKKDRELDHLKKKIAERKDLLDRKIKDAETLVQQQTQRLHEVSGLSREQAERALLERLEVELSGAMADRIRRFEENLHATAEEKAQRILATAVHRYAAEHTADSTVSTVDIPSDDMKGRIIGREGRNIRTFEKATGVDVIVDDTPGVVIVSAFDNVRRETARIALTKLIQDGRIHPTRIEEVVKETQAEMERLVLDIGRRAAQDVGVTQVNEKLLQLLGRLKFRTSYSQNVLLHSLEVAHLSGMIADELHLDGTLARRCGLLHDVGKAADHEMEGGHPKIGAELAKRYGESNKDVLHAILGHHDDITVDHIYTVIVASADAISASRPGARRETLEKYVKRLEHLEAVASGFPGVEQAYAIQAGREVRVIANAQHTSDNEAVKMCHDIARAIEQQLDYPGEIKVTVVRETRAVEFAK
jgi:ribonucrease Y